MTKGTPTLRKHRFALTQKSTPPHTAARSPRFAMITLAICSVILNGCHTLPQQTRQPTHPVTAFSTAHHTEHRRSNVFPNDTNAVADFPAMSLAAPQAFAWHHNPIAALKQLEQFIDHALEAGQLAQARTALLTAGKTVRTIDHPQQTVITSTTSNNLLDCMHALNKRIDDYHQQIDDRLTDHAKLHRARWLHTELQRLQLKANRKGFHPLTRFQLRHYQRQTQTLLQEALKRTAHYINAGNLSAADQQAPYLALLTGRPSAPPSNKALTENAALTQNLLQQAYAPVLNNAEIKSALQQVTSYFKSVDNHHFFAARDHSHQTALHHKSKQHTADTLQTPLGSKKAPKPPNRTKHKAVKPKWITLAKDLDHAVSIGDLPSIGRLIQALKAQPELPIEQRLRAEAMESFLEHQVASFDAQADTLYQQGNIQDAKTLWQILQALRPSDPQLMAKIARAEKVLENLEALREQPLP